ncbi:hypothetical protein B0H13DRAFT_1863882 [Mycena leptocephala]|nr:hypothetical protein B0H13DRAFT_1863882 [Mycena leptocephala]
MTDYISVVREPTAPFTDTHASIALEDEDIEMEDYITATHDEDIEMEDSILEPLRGPLVQKPARSDTAGAHDRLRTISARGLSSTRARRNTIKPCCLLPLK